MKLILIKRYAVTPFNGSVKKIKHNECVAQSAHIELIDNESQHGVYPTLSEAV
jgi:hypothetical protein